MNNQNDNGGGGVRVDGGGAAGGGGGGAGGGGGWLFYGAAATGVAVGVGLAYAVWNMYQSSKKLKEVDQTVRSHQDYIEQDQQEKLTEVENLLVERQHVFCSNFNRHQYRQELEGRILQKSSVLESVIPDMSNTVKRIFNEDHHCGSTLTYIRTRDKRNNGCLMWEEMKNWRRMVKNSEQS